MYKNIQFLRAAASILVVLFHGAPIVGLVPGNHWVMGLIKHGYIGVDVFFVISGFVVSLTVDNALASGLSGFHYFAKRVSRIYVGYWPFYFYSI
jgi:exopolysaccharide production protein ExoZ